jgi:hypothetical protein
VRATGPGPLRTARGAGLFVEGRRAGVDRVLRDREVEALVVVFGFDFVVEDREEDVLLLRDPGGEDVRVAMLEG